ncbi:MAG: hypothetical protein KGJ80_12025 [Chloroflexota bacterium]|nr:hypothetical protein [Chloroflexota bacterium]
MSSSEQPKPNLVHIMLPPYEVPDLIVIGGVVVENRGNAPANNVKIVLEYDGATAEMIRHLRVASDVEYILLGGGDRQSFATIRARQLGAGQRMVIYFSGPGRIQPQVRVTHYEG